METETPRLCPEARLLLLCGGARTSAEKTERQRELICAGLDWDHLIKSALNHRMIPLLYWTLITTSQDLVPGDVLKDLRMIHLLNARRNILLAGELIRVIKSMETQGIPVLPFKGPVLAASAYGDLSLRQFDDLDILVPLARLAEVDELLISMGYEDEQQHRRVSKKQKEAMLKYQHHHHFYRPDSKVHLEVHWTLSPELYSFHQDTASLWDRSEKVTLLNRELMGLSSEDTMVLICDHAARHQWNRLAWISDVAMILDSKHLKWDLVVEQANKWRARRALLLGLFLANELLGASIPDDIDRLITEDQKVRVLASEAIDGLYLDESASAFSSDPARGEIQDQLFYVRARDRFFDRARLYLRLATTPTVEDWNYLSIPDPLFSFYYLIRPVRLANAYRMRILNWLMK